jgi:hypothetical protein
MSHFYGTLQGTRGEATRCGTKNSGLVAYAASWSGAIRVQLIHDDGTGKDSYIVEQVPWRGCGAMAQLASGTLGEPTPSKSEIQAAWLKNEAIEAARSAIRECLPDLEHYVSTHGPGPDARLKELRDALVGLDSIA